MSVDDVNVAGIHSKVQANFELQESHLVNVLALVQKKYGLDEVGGLHYITEQLAVRMTEGQNRTEQQNNVHVSRQHSNILSDDDEQSKEYEELQAAFDFVAFRKKISDVLHGIKSGDVRGVIKLFETDPSMLSYHDQDGWNLLFHGIAAKNDLAVRWILTQDGFDCNHKDRSNLTALHWAAFKGNVKICKMLIQVKADLEQAVDRAGCTPLHLAAHEGQKDVCEWFYTNFPSTVTQQDRDGVTPLHYAALQGHTDLLFAMIEFINALASFDVCRLEDNERANILHYAAGAGHLDMVKRLCESHHLLVLQQSTTMQRPVDTARSSGQCAVFEYLNQTTTRVTLAMAKIQRQKSLSDILTIGFGENFTSIPSKDAEIVEVRGSKLPIKDTS